MQSMYTVDGGHRAIMFNRIGGIQDYSLTEGLHFRLPWLQYPIIYDIGARPRKITSPTGSKDLQMVNISLRVLSRPDSNNLPAVHRELGKDYAAAVEAKQIAQQEAARAAYHVDKAVQEKQGKIGQAISENPGYLKLRKLAAAQKISGTVAQSQNRVYLNAGSLLLNINDAEFDSKIMNTAKGASSL